MGVWAWLKTANGNASVDPLINYSIGMAPSAVGSSGRAVMAGIATWRDDISGSLATTGTSSAYILNSNQAVAPVDGQMIAFTPHVTNVGSGITVDGVAGSIQTAVGTNVIPGALVASTPYRAKYVAASTAWVLEGFYGNPYNLPVGGTFPYIAGSAPNSNFAIPYGQAISRSTYAVLFALCGTTFGAGDGSTTFNLPDLRGKVPAGVDNMGSGVSGGYFPGLNPGTVQGSTTHVLTQAELPNVAVAVSVSGSVSGSTSPNISVTGSGTVSTTSTRGDILFGSSVAAQGGGSFTGGQLSGNGVLTATGTTSVITSTGVNAISLTSSGSMTGNTAGLGANNPHSIVQPTIALFYLMRII